MRGGSQRNDQDMVAGKLLFETAKYSIQRAKEGYDLLYAVGAGTAIGISSGENVRGAYELWKGTSRRNTKARIKRWDYRSLRRRFKGDVLIDEGTNKKQETYFPDKPINRGASSGGKYNIRKGSRNYKHYSRRYGRRCDCESLLYRILGKPRFSKRRR